MTTATRVAPLVHNTVNTRQHPPYIWENLVTLQGLKSFGARIQQTIPVEEEQVYFLPRVKKKKKKM